eukprot:835568-Pyramimonas_sp.AAC.1
MRVCGGAISGVTEKDVRKGEVAKKHSDLKETELELRRDNQGCVFWGNGSYSTGTHQLQGEGFTETIVLCLAEESERLRVECALSSVSASWTCDLLGLALQRASLEDWEGATSRLAPGDEGHEGSVEVAEDYIIAGEVNPGGPGGASWQENFMRWRGKLGRSDGVLRLNDENAKVVLATEEALLLVRESPSEMEVRLIWHTAGLGIGRVYSTDGKLLRVVLYEKTT